MMTKQQIKEIIKEMIQDGEIRIVVEGKSGIYNNIRIDSEYLVQNIVEGMKFELEVEG